MIHNQRRISFDKSVPISDFPIISPIQKDFHTSFQKIIFLVSITSASACQRQSSLAAMERSGIAVQCSALFKEAAPRQKP